VEITMRTCDAFQAELLNHLYDLLDDEERRDLAAHLDTCPDCQAARTALEGKRKLLAAAAKTEFPGVRFQPPAEEPAPAAPRKVSLPTPVLPKWGKWAIAAGLLLTVGLAGGLAGMGYARHRSAVDMARAEEDKVKESQRDKDRRYEEDIKAVQ